MTFLFTLINKTFCKIVYYSSDLCKIVVVTYLVFISVKSGCKKTPKIGYCPCSSVQRPARCNVHPDAPFSSVPRPARCNVHPEAPCCSVPRPALCNVHPGAPLSLVPPSAACPGQLSSSPTTTAGHLAATCNTLTPVVTYSARNVFISYVILSEQIVIIFLHSIKSLAFMTTKWVFCEVGNKWRSIGLLRPRGKPANEGSEMLIKAVWEMCKVNSGSSSEKSGSHSGTIEDLRPLCR